MTYPPDRAPALTPFPSRPAAALRLADRSGSSAPAWASAAALVGCVAVVGAGCGGNAIIDPPLSSEGGSGGTGGSTTSTTTTHVGAMGGGGAGGQGGTYVPPVDALVEHELGPVESGERVDFEVEPPILGMTITAEIPSEFVEITVDEVIAPNGTFLVDDATMPNSSAWYIGLGLAVAAVPQSDHTEAMPVMGGTWQLSTQTDYSGGPVDLSVWTRHTVDGQFHGGVVDVNVFRVPSVSSQSYMIDVVHAAFDQWHGLDVGQISFYPLDESYFVLDDTEIFDIFAETAAAERRPSLNVMVVGDFSGDLYGAAGFTMGAPASPLHHGNILSGVVMLTMGYEDMDALVLRHETGHLSGLFHTTEIEGDVTDLLDDTPECDDVMSEMESCPDFSNLMFPVAGSPVMALTPKQIRVVRGSALYRGIVQEGDPPVPPLSEGANTSSAEAPDHDSDLDEPASAGTAPAGQDRPLALAVAPAEQPWATELSPVLAAYLSGVWEIGYGSSSPMEVAAGLAGRDARLLWSIGADHRAPAHVRMRAIMALGSLYLGPELRRQLSRLAATRAAHPRVRVAALRALAAAGAPELSELRLRLRGDADMLVSQVAEQM